MSRVLVLCGAALLAAPACGDNFAHPDGGPPGDDGAIDAAPDGATDAAPDGAIDAAPDGGVTIVYPPGALVRVTAEGQVGVLLEDFPASMRNRMATALAALPAQFWIDRAKQQLRLSTLRLIYRELYYPAMSGRDSLPLTEPTAWDIVLSGTPARATVDGHDHVAVSYTMTTTLLTDEASPGTTEPALEDVGGTWTESFEFPVDPTLILQRTGYACMDEDQFPADSVDEENAWEFYDDWCKVEGPGSQVCHLTLPLPDRSCIKAVHDEIGGTTVDINFERIAWDATVADSVRRGPVTAQATPDLSVVTTGPISLSNNYVKYKYVPPGDCALLEGCVGAPGWRRLITFDSYDHNIGGGPLHIGPVDYDVAGLGSELIDHNVYELSACHDHYHFEYYGDFFFGAGSNELNKNGFCLESTGRISNNELSPLHTPYDCHNQGVSPGWGDLYAAGLPCNWVDVTDVDTSAGAVTRQLTFASNPDNFLCEGTLDRDSQGNQIWEPTSFTAENGEPVDRPACTETPGAETNDVGMVPVTLPQRGGMLTTACTDTQALGPRRNCGFTAQATLLSCTAGQQVTLACTGGSMTQPMAVRACESSRALGGGTDCGFSDALANFTVEGGVTATVTCPAARDAVEIGGQIAVYAAPVYAADGANAVTCTIQ